MDKGFIEKIKEAGIVGMGGAGFPTHVKLNNKAEFFIVNVAECEPLLKVDQQIAERFAEKIIKSINIILENIQAKKAYIGIKKKYKKAIDSLKKYIQNGKIELKTLEDVYPAGDEYVLVYNITGRLIPAGGLPLDVGVIVDNVHTVLSIFDALEGKPLTYRWVTVTGAVKKPGTFYLPIGLYFKDIITKVEPIVTEYKIIEGGPMMGEIVDENETVKKTTSGIIVLPADHYLVQRKQETIERSILHSRSVCEQCSMCTELCSRYINGVEPLKPHLWMRKISYLNEYNLNEYTFAYLCSECGLCTFYSCPMLLSPRDIARFLKKAMRQNNIDNPYKGMKFSSVHARYEERRVPTEKLKLRLGLKNYDKPAPLTFEEVDFGKLKIKLNQHIGAPAQPVVKEGDIVQSGDLIADIPSGKLGARIHSPVKAKILKINNDSIELEKY